MLLIVNERIAFVQGGISIMALLIRFVIIALIIYAFYRGVRYLLDPKRKLDEAHQKGQFYFYDDVKNVRKNFFITYRGALFEGEKYLGTTDQAFEVVSILVSTPDIARLQGFTRDDFIYLTKEITINYPHADITWQGPIEDLMKKA